MNTTPATAAQPAVPADMEQAPQQAGFDLDSDEPLAACPLRPSDSDGPCEACQ